jgi:hypothetical protein
LQKASDDRFNHISGIEGIVSNNNNPLSHQHGLDNMACIHVSLPKGCKDICIMICVDTVLSIAMEFLTIRL